MSVHGKETKEQLLKLVSQAAKIYSKYIAAPENAVNAIKHCVYKEMI